MIYMTASERYSQGVLEKVHIIITRRWSFHDRQQVLGAWMENKDHTELQLQTFKNKRKGQVHTQNFNFT